MYGKLSSVAVNDFLQMSKQLVLRNLFVFVFVNVLDILFSIMKRSIPFSSHSSQPHV
jgi:hypothetical protein